MLQNNLRIFGSAFRSIVPSVPLRNVTMRTTQTSTIDIQPAPNQIPTYSREYLRDLLEKPTEEQIRRAQEEQIIKDRLQRIYDTKQNDRNPMNFVKVKVNLMEKYKLEETPTTTIAQIDHLTRNISRPFILYNQPKPKKICVQGIRRKVPVSLKKIIPVMRAIIGKHVYDAINYCANLETKAAKFVRLTLNQVKRHAEQIDLAEDRLYVVDAISGKNKRWKRVRYHAKGRGAMMNKDTTQLMIRLEEKPVEVMFKEMIQGKFPPALAYIIRKKLLATDADYELIRRNNFILTARGRQQRKLMFKRQVIKEKLAFMEKGVQISTNLIEKKILEEEARKFAQVYRNAQEREKSTSLSERQALFKKNEEAVGL